MFRIKFLMCLTFNIVLFSLSYFGYVDIREKKEIMNISEPIKVKVLKISTGRSRADCQVEFNNKIYSVALPSGIREGDINKKDFYYDNSKNEVFSNNIGLNALKVLLIMFIISLLLWFVPKKYFT